MQYLYYPDNKKYDIILSKAIISCISVLMANEKCIKRARVNELLTVNVYAVIA